MLRFALRRLALALLVLVAVSIAAFSLVHIGGNVAVSLAGEGARKADLEIVRKQYGLDQPLPVQYGRWLARTVQGDLGESLFFKKPVVDLVLERLPTTMTLGLLAMGFALLLAVPLGILAALRPNSWIDRIALFVAVIGQAMPSFWFALLLIVWFGVGLRWLPISGSDTWLHFVMPTIALGYYATPAIMRLVRAGMMEVLESDYIRTARAKGLPASTIIFKHALRNAVIPVVALAAVQLGLVLGGSVVIETVFALHGLGFLAWESINQNDLPVVQAVILLLSAIYIVLTLLADIANAWLDPRLRLAGT
ncbi:MAG TPA: ABC transporter permease [Usitatibacter sp.]|nr:ABC transporter permease [Usitatibacter sp.]